MNEQDYQKLKELGSYFRRMNGKIKLLGLLKKAKEEYDQNKFKDCIVTCKKALATDPKNAIALRGLGCAMQAIGNYKQALKFYLQALETSSNKEIEYTLIGTLYYNENNYNEAIKYYNLAIDVNDSYDPAYDGKNQSILENHLQILDMQDALIKREMFK